MASSSAGDPKQKHGEQQAAGMMGRNGSDSYKQYYDDSPSEEWQSSSPSSTRQMLSRRRRFTPVAFVRKIDWGSLWDKAKEWIRNPMNMALLVWIIAVGVSGAILFMVMTGMLNRVLPTKPQRDAWFEVNNQILNALFTLLCLYQHPRRFYHLVLLCRWRAGDMLQLRQVYCKDGTCKPSERKHITVVHWWSCCCISTAWRSTRCAASSLGTVGRSAAGCVGRHVAGLPLRVLQLLRIIVHVVVIAAGGLLVVVLRLGLVVVPERAEVVVQPGHRRRADGHEMVRATPMTGRSGLRYPRLRPHSAYCAKQLRCSSRTTTVMCFLSPGLQVPSLQ